VTGIAIKAIDAPSSAMTFTVDNIQLVRKDPSVSAPNPFQRTINGSWTRDFAITLCITQMGFGCKKN
jgi:hypothetical protein